MLKTENTPMQKTNNVTCWVIMMMDFLRYKKRRPKDFCKLPWITKLIKNEQNVSVRSCKKIEYTPSQLNENKGRA